MIGLFVLQLVNGTLPPPPPPAVRDGFGSAIEWSCNLNGASGSKLFTGRLRLAKYLPEPGVFSVRGRAGRDQAVLEIDKSPIQELVGKHSVYLNYNYQYQFFFAELNTVPNEYSYMVRFDFHQPSGPPKTILNHVAIRRSTSSNNIIDMAAFDRKKAHWEKQSSELLDTGSCVTL